MCVDYRLAWEGRILIGKRSSTCNIFGCPKTHSSISHRDLASPSKESTHLRRAIPPGKRLAVVLHWPAQASSFSELAVLYGIAKSTVVAIVHQGITILQEKLVHEAILFPTGPELEQVMLDFEALCGLPCCGGALDGTFMSITTPSDFGDTYYCYKHFTAIIVLGCVDARGIFTYVNAG